MDWIRAISILVLLICGSNLHAQQQMGGQMGGQTNVISITPSTLGQQAAFTTIGTSTNSFTRNATSIPFVIGVTNAKIKGKITTMSPLPVPLPM
jgi:hypothetical protein